MNYFLKNLEYISEKRDMKFISRTNIEKALTILEDLTKISNYCGVTIDDLVKKDLSKREIKLNNIKMLILDIDGVLSDGGMYVSEKGDEIKKFNTKDGLAILELGKKGFELGIISSGFREKIVKQRAERLKISKVYVGRKPKIDVLKEWLEEMNLEERNIAYIGDDLNDLEIMKMVGVSACPSNAVTKIKEVSDIILEKEGGKGCVREFIDKYILT